MRKLAKLTLITFILWLTTYGLWTTSYAAIPHLINYQGRLTDKDAKPLEGAYTLTFRIYDAENAGNLLWEETHSGVVIQKGIFGILLGSVTNLSLAFDKSYFLEIKVGNEVMSPRQRITSSGYAIRAENSEKIEDKYLSDLIQVGTTAAGDLSGTYPAPTIAAGVLNTSKLADGAVSQAKLKTAIGEVSTGSNGTITLPGGTYGFYPQTRCSSGGYKAQIAGVANVSNASNTNYATLIGFETAGGNTMYAQQRYVTSSGKDHWLFVLVDKTTKDIISLWSAPDAPWYGNGGKQEKLPQPFGDYDPRKHEITLIDQDTITELKSQVTEEKSLVTLVNEDYKVNMDREEAYKPLHSGKYLTEDGKYVAEMVKSIPSYIKVRKLFKMPKKDKLNTRDGAKQKST